MKRLIAVLITILAFTLAKPLLAQTAPGDPFFSMKRVSVGFGVEREVLNTYATEDEAWNAVLPVAYNVLSPPAGQQGIRASLSLRVSQSFDINRDPEAWVGIRLSWRGSTQ